MKPTTFPEANRTLQAPPNMPDCQPLRVHRSEETGQWISRWRPTWRERVSILVRGECWVHVVGFTHQPIYVGGSSPFPRPTPFKRLLLWWTQRNANRAARMAARNLAGA